MKTITNSLWLIKKIRPSRWTRSSQPAGSGPRSSTAAGPEALPALPAPEEPLLPPEAPRLAALLEPLFEPAELRLAGDGLALPVRGSFHVVVRVLWSMKKTRPFSATCCDHPGGRGPRPSSGTVVRELEPRLPVEVCARLRPLD